MSSNIKFISYLATIEAKFLQKSSAFLGQVLHHHTLDANLQRKKPYNIMEIMVFYVEFFFFLILPGTEKGQLFAN